MKERERRELKEDEIIPYIWRTENYGRAEFTFCPVWKRGKLVELFIDPRQQPDVDWYYHIEGFHCDSFQLTAWTHKGFENPWAWLYAYCRKHHCMSIITYVPPQTNYLKVRIYSTLEVLFDRLKEEEGGEQV